MKKLKEFLFFPLCIFLLIAIFLAYYVLLGQNGSYTANFNSIINVLNGGLFSMIIDIFMLPFLISAGAVFVATFVMLFLKYKKNFKITRRHFYYAHAVISAAITFITIFFKSTAFSDAIGIDASFQTNIYTLMFSAFVALLVTLIYWLVELAVNSIIKSLKK